ncbi:MAG: hypothetical protein GYA02_08065 [Clostridiaceae bacterium]|nr:hypothetical protein [Clostridiaceae bacterium]
MSIVKKFLNIILLPGSVYKRITDKKLTLILGIFFVGIVDLVFAMVDNFKGYFSEGDLGKTVFNIALAILFIVLLGVVDVLFFSLPMFDLFKRFKKSEGLSITNETGQFVKLVKIYVIAHFLILIPQIIMFLIYQNVISTLNINSWWLYLAFFIDLIIPIWFSGAISRGVNVIYKFRTIFARLSFLVLFVWNYVLGYALSYIISNWIIPLFKV